MNRVEELIQQLCPNGVEWKKLGEVCEILDSQRRPVEKTKRSIGKYPYYGANGIQDYVDDFLFNGTFLLVGEDGSVINKDNSPILNWATGKIWVNNHAHILSERKEIMSLRFLYFVLSVKDISKLVRGVPPKLNQVNLRNIEIPIPPLPIQQEIVRILDTFTELQKELTANLQTELDARKKQYAYYRDCLLNFEGVDGVEWKKLGEVCEKTYNIKWDTCDNIYQYIDLSSVNINNHNIEETQEINKENAPSRAQQIVLYNDVLLGTTRPMLKRICIIPLEYNEQICSTGFCVLRVNKNILLPRFLYFFISTNSFFDYVEKNQEGAGYPSISNIKIFKFQIPVPPLPEQRRIVAILDHFETLVNDLSVGLPAELEARRKQYEYYRDKLLTFDRV